MKTNKPSHAQPLARVGHCLSSMVVVVALLALVGCGGTSAKVTGRVTCHGKPVVGGIQFSPKGEGASNTGPTVTAELKEDGTYALQLKSIGKHTVVITPRDLKYPVPKGEFDYPCDHSPLEREVKAGDNDISIELTPRTK